MRPELSVSGVGVGVTNGGLRRTLKAGAVAAAAVVVSRQWRRGVQAERELADARQRNDESSLHDGAAQDAIARAHADMESLLYTVSHDLKSPLLTVLGYIDLLRAEPVELAGEAARHVERIEASSLYMQQLINDLLMLSRIGRMEARAEDVEVADLAREVADELRAQSPGATVEVGTLPAVTMSPVRARQLLTNLIGNAMNHAGRHDVTVDVGAKRLPDGGALLWIADDGRGVPAQHRERVFGVFERLDERPAGEAGTGIGLAVCRKIVNQLDGTMRLADVPLGATVEIVLPGRVTAWRPSVGAEA